MSEQASDGEIVAIGRVGKPIGLRGEVAVTPFGATLIEFLKIPCTVILSGPQGERKQVPLVQRRLRNDVVACVFGGYESREGAEVLRDSLVSIERSRLPTLGDDSFYHFELEGMEVILIPENTTLGKVLSVHQYPTTDALEVEREGERAVIIPLSGGAVERIDKEARRIYVHSELIDELL